MENMRFVVNVPQTFREGYGVAFSPVYTDENENTIAEIDPIVVRISPADIKIIGDVPCVTGDSGNYPVELFQELEDLWEGDTHDLRSRWFATREQAQEHADSVTKRWASPMPWECFVKL